MKKRVDKLCVKCDTLYMENTNIQPNHKLANKRVELINQNFKPTGNDVTAEFENGFRTFENWKKENESVMIIIDRLSNGVVTNVDWINA